MKNEFTGKKVLIVGMGRSGLGAAELLIESGAIISLQDSKADCLSPEKYAEFEKAGAKFYLGSKPADVSVFHAVVVSPGVPPEVDFIQEAAKAGAEVIGELELAYRLGKGTYVAITGTNGKTTTTTLVGEIFKESGRKTAVVGNIGNSVAKEACTSTEDEWLVTEVSSFQLETIRDFRPKVSAILNFTPDHLDRHKTYENYMAAKARVFENQEADDFVILNGTDEEVMKYAPLTKGIVVPFGIDIEATPGAYVEDGIITICDVDGKKTELCKADELKIPGKHNLENALAAAAVCYFAGIESDVITKVLKSFKGVEHRIEDCGIVNGIRYINDSKGTNPDAAIMAVRAIDTDIILIAGGYDKGSDFTDLINEFGDKVKHMVLLGATAAKIKSAAEKLGYHNTTIVGDMEACVREATRFAKAGDTVLLSPACASWDMYKSYEHRGRHFKECVEKIDK